MFDKPFCKRTKNLTLGLKGFNLIWVYYQMFNVKFSYFINLSSYYFVDCLISLVPNENLLL